MAVPVVGPVIGSGEATSGYTVDVTLTDDVDRTTPNDLKGILVVVATQEPAGTLDLLPYGDIVVTDDSPVAPGRPYGTMENYLQGTNMVWTDNPQGASLIAVRGPAYWPHIAHIRAALPYIVVRDLGVGNVVTVDLSALSPNEPEYIGVNIHPISNPSGFSDAAVTNVGGFAESMDFDTADLGHAVSGLGMCSVISPWMSQDFYAYFRGTSGTSPDGDPFAGTVYELEPSTSPGFHLMYGFYEYLTSFSGHVNGGGTPAAYFQSGAGWPDAGEAAAGPDWGVGICFSWTPGSTGGIPYRRRPQFIRHD